MHELKTFKTAQCEPIIIGDVSASSFLQLSPITVDDDYAKKWNIRLKDFVCLTNNGNLINNCLYRVGGLKTPKLNKDEYFMLIKYVEAFYPKHITYHTKNDPKHLEGRWCIFDKYGNEKVEFKQFDSPYLVDNSCIYSIDSKYYNIETGEFYCYSSSGSWESADFIFLNNRFDNDKSRRGIMKVNKKSGTYEIFS